MRLSTKQSHNAGIELLDIAEQYKEFRPDLNDKQALKLAMIGNPDLAEIYLGCEVRRDAVDDVKKFLANG
jgi:hypothetical protein